jgi:hypothetical protein
MTRDDAFDPVRIIEILDLHRVEFVLVGGYAALLYGARRPTYDIDITPSMTVGNLQRLSDALHDLKAGIRVDNLDDGLPFDSSAESLRGVQMLNLRSPFGDLDITFFPSGFPDGYDSLRPGAHLYTVGTVTIHVADLDDVIKSKEAAARPKDLDALPELINLARARKRNDNHHHHHNRACGR